MKLSPALFLVLEFFMIFPSALFLLGFINYGLVQNLFILIIDPFAGGFLAYNYLERYGPKGFIRTLTKIIIAYSILEIGIVLFSTLVS